MSTAATAATAASLLARCNALGIVLQADSGRLVMYGRPDDLTPELQAKLQAHKGELLATLASGSSGPQDMQPGGCLAPVPQDIDSDAADWQPYSTPDGRRGLVRSDAADLQVIDLPSPCPTCGGIVFWWDLAGGAHCGDCSPRTRAAELRQRVAAARTRYPVERDSDADPQDNPDRQLPTLPEAVPVAILAAKVPTCSGCGVLGVPGQPGSPAGLCFECWIRRAGR